VSPAVTARLDCLPVGFGAEPFEGVESVGPVGASAEAVVDLPSQPLARGEPDGRGTPVASRHAARYRLGRTYRQKSVRFPETHATRTLVNARVWIRITGVWAAQPTLG